MPKKNQKTQPKPKREASLAAPTGSTLSQCYLEHAARETAWMAQNAQDCNYAAAAAGETRRGVWLMAALIAQERKS